MTLNNQNRERSNATGRDNGNVQRNYGRYIALAKDAASRGDGLKVRIAISMPSSTGCFTSGRLFVPL